MKILVRGAAAVAVAAVMAVGSAAPSGAAPRRAWTTVSQSATEDIQIAVPYERVDPETGVIFVWERFQPRKGKLTAARNARLRNTGDPLYKRWGYTMILLGVDCDNYEIGEFQTIDYTTTGAVLRNDDPDVEDVVVEDIVPGSVGEGVADVLCETFR
jgi:hypothetical protein